MTDQAAAATTTTEAPSSPSQAIADARAQILADDSIGVDAPASAEPGETRGEPAADPGKPGEAKPDPPAAEEQRETIDDLILLAEEKRRERLQREAQDDRQRRERDLDRERDDFERQRREFERREKELEADPLDYLERRKGWDRSLAAEKIVSKTLRPGEEELRERLAATEARLAKFETETKAEKEAREKAELGARERAHVEQTYTSWDSLTSSEQFPHLAKLPTAIRRQYGDHVANLLTEAGKPWTQETIANLVEHDLATRYGQSAVASGSSAGESETKDGSPRGGEKPPPSTLTNDLASESAGSIRDLRDPEVRRKNALNEAARLGLK